MVKVQGFGLKVSDRAERQSRLHWVEKTLGRDLQASPRV